MTRILVLAAFVPLAACTDLAPKYEVQFCYEGETCSSDTPQGLEFRGTDVTGEQGGSPGPLAIGGTQNVKLLDPTRDLSRPVPFERPYATDSSMASDGRFPVGTEVVDHDGNVVTVRGIAEGYNYLRVLAPDGTLYDRTVLSAQAIDHLQVRPPYEYGGPGPAETIVWAPGPHVMSVGLWGAPHPDLGSSGDLLVDESLVLAMEGATQTRWDTISVPRAPAGHRDLMVAGGSGVAVLDVETVDAPDTIVSADANYFPISIYGSNRLCFVARHQGRYVAGVEWSFTMDDGEVLTDETIDTPHSGCAYFAAHVQGTVRIHATASGHTQTLEVTAH